jgi:hypothetical protein
MEAEDSQAGGRGCSFESPAEGSTVEWSAEAVAEHVVGRARKLASLLGSGEGVSRAV